MECQALLLLKNEKKKINLSSAAVDINTIMVYG